MSLTEALSQFVAKATNCVLGTQPTQGPESATFQPRSGDRCIDKTRHLPSLPRLFQLETCVPRTIKVRGYRMPLLRNLPLPFRIGSL